jgi:hypothetical protein
MGNATVTPVLSRAEAAAVFLVTCPAVAIILAFGGDSIGLALHPISTLMLSLAAATVLTGLARAVPVESFDSLALSLSKGELAQDRAADLGAFLAIVGLMSAWLLWLAWPHLLPISGGSDLTHHLLLVDYIERSGRLVQDPALRPYLGDMIDYSPGIHVLAVLAGAWTRTSGLQTVYPLVALSVAIKAGFIFLIARRSVHRNPQALIAPLLLFLPYGYFLGSFTHDSFLAQVASELFAVAMWWAVMCWDEQPSPLLAAIIGILGVAAYLTWPVWLGPIVVTLVAVAWLHRDRPLRDRLAHLAIALVPVVAIAVFQSARRLGAASNMAGASGFALTPTLETMGWLLPAAGLVGATVAVRDRRARTVPILLAAIVLQAAAFLVIARANGADAPYLTLKTIYLAIYPLAVGGAIAASAFGRSAEASRSTENDDVRAVTRATGARGDGVPGKRFVRGGVPFSRASWLLVALALIPVARLVRATPRPMPVVSVDLLEAGRWARSHVPPACVDYLVADDDSAYWLHLVVLGNSRITARSLASETFEPQKAVVRWILPGGLPYAIVSDLESLPRDIRTTVDTLARFGRAAVIKRRGESSCPGS